MEKNLTAEQIENLNMLTEMERDVLQSIERNDFYRECGWAWTNTAFDRLDVCTESQARGALTSLKRKGLVESNGSIGRDACVRLTAKAAEYGCIIVNEY